jgi:hypothetical protein
MDFGVGQGAKRSVDIHSHLDQASNAGQRQNQRNPGRREAKGQLAASLARYSPLRGCASLAPCHPPFCLYARPIAVLQQSPKRTGVLSLRQSSFTAQPWWHRESSVPVGWGWQSRPRCFRQRAVRPRADWSQHLPPLMIPNHRCSGICCRYWQPRSGR